MTRKETPDLEEFKDKNFDLNNFELNLPDDKEPAIPGEPKIRSGHHQRQVFERGWLNQRPSREKMGSEAALYSPLYLGQPYRSFFAAIDAAIEESGLDPTITEYFKRKTSGEWDLVNFTAADEARLSESRAAQKKFYADIMPLYVYLRKKGYSWYDLTG